MSRSSIGRAFLGVVPGLAVAAAAWASLAGCGGQTATDEPRTVRVFCDGALTDVIEEIATAFQRRSDVRVVIESGASEALLERLEAAPASADLFLPFGDSYLEDGGELIADSEIVAWTVPVLLVRQGNGRTIGRVADLSGSGLALGWDTNPRSPLGRILPGLLASHGLDYSDIADNVILESESGAELGNALRLGRIDATVLWHPMAVHVSRSERISVGDPVDTAVALAVGKASAASHPEDARAFMAFLRGPAARALFERYHYQTEAPEHWDVPSADGVDDGIVETVF